MLFFLFSFLCLTGTVSCTLKHNIAFKDRVKFAPEEVSGASIKPEIETFPSVLRKVSKADVVTKPFPHVVVKNCLPEEVYVQLALTYPDYWQIMEIRNSDPYASNIRLDLSQNEILSGRVPNISSVWKQFVKYHSSQKFYYEVVKIFGESMRSYLGHHEKRLKKSFSSCKTAVRDSRKVRKDCDISLGVNIGINTPSKFGGSSVRREHLDRNREIYAGLLYFREEKDKSSGGALEILSCRKKRCKKLPNSKRNFIRRKIGWDVEYNPSDLQTSVRVPYEENTFVFFLNGPLSFHKVTERTETTFPRRLVNIIADRAS